MIIYPNLHHISILNCACVLQRVVFHSSTEDMLNSVDDKNLFDPQMCFICYYLMPACCF